MPDHVAARVSNHVEVAAPPAVVWASLVRAADWPLWYSNSANVRIVDGGSDLSLGARFTWRTFGVSVRSTVREFVAGERIAWDGSGLGLDVYHAWLIEPRPAGCFVLTEEHQNGWAARLQALLMPQRMFRGHQLWLEQLKRRAEASSGA